MPKRHLAKKPRNTSADDLAVMIARGFDRTYSDIKVLDARLDKVEKQLDRLEEGHQVIETKLDRALYTQVTHLEARVKRLEDRVGIKP